LTGVEVSLLPASHAFSEDKVAFETLTSDEPHRTQPELVMLLFEGEFMLTEESLPPLLHPDFGDKLVALADFRLPPLYPDFADKLADFRLPLLPDFEKELLLPVEYLSWEPLRTLTRVGPRWLSSFLDDLCFNF